MIPALNRKGFLPQGIHPATIEEVGRYFGSSNARRKALFSGLEKALRNLSAAGARKVYLNGSFVTKKDNPNDIDGCWEPNESTDVTKLDPVFLDFRRCEGHHRDRFGG